MSNLQVTAKILHIGEVETVSDKFQKRTIVLDMSEEYNGTKYDNPVPFQVSQKKIDLFKDCRVGQEVTVHFNLKGRKWEKDGKVSWFGSSEVWKVEAGAMPSYASAPQAAPVQAAPIEHNATAVDDLPF